MLFRDRERHGEGGDVGYSHVGIQTRIIMDS
jgi:hypothetical protein